MAGYLSAILDVLAYVEEGSDHLADWRRQVERDVFHALAGLASGLSVLGAPLYVWRLARKQRLDGREDPAAKRDARLDLIAGTAGVVVGLSAQGVALFAAWWMPVVMALGMLLSAAGMTAWSIKARRP